MDMVGMKSIGMTGMKSTGMVGVKSMGMGAARVTNDIKSIHSHSPAGTTERPS